MRRVAARAARATFPVLKRTPLRRITEHGWFIRFRERVYAMDAGDALEVLDALARAGVPSWLVGGWGVDALLGTVTRTHGDADVLVEDSSEGRKRAVAALAPLGYAPGEDEGVAGHWLPVRSVVRDRAGRTVDLLSVRTAGSGDHGASGVPLLQPDDLAFGRLAGRDVPCASATLQLRLHTGYRPTEQDRRDVLELCTRFALPLPREYASADDTRRSSWRRLATVVARRRMRRLPASAVVVPVLAAADVVALGATGSPADSVPAHVTVLYPFVPGPTLTDADVDGLRHLAATTEPFAMNLAIVGRFPDVLYVAPERDAALRLVSLTEALAARWPSCPPYGGRFTAIVPHLTVYEGRSEPEGLEARVVAHLPIDATADELWLLVQDEHRRWSIRERFRLGSPSATPP